MMRGSALVVLGIAACACQPGPPPEKFEGPFLPDDETGMGQYEPAMVATPVQPFSPNGLLYAASIQTLSRGFPNTNDAGLTEVTWETHSWKSIWASCGFSGFIGADPAMTLSRTQEPELSSQPVYVTTDPRGAHEYETMAHIPGTADWIGVWGQPKNPDSAADPLVGEFRLRYTTWD